MGKLLKCKQQEKLTLPARLIFFEYEVIFRRCKSSGHNILLALLKALVGQPLLPQPSV